MFYGWKKYSGTIIAEQARLEGDIIGQEDIYINGSIIGNIIETTQEIKIGQSAKIEADLKAKNIIIEGEVRGAIRAENRLDIKATGNVEGNIEAQIFSVATNALLTGECRVGEGDKQWTEEVVKQEDFGNLMSEKPLAEKENKPFLNHNINNGQTE